MKKPLYLEEFPSFGDFDRACLQQILTQLNAPKPTIVELGSWLGTGSTEILIDHVRQYGGRLHCVDTWQGSSGVERHSEILASYDVFGSFLENVSRFGGAAWVEAHRNNSLEASTEFKDASVDMVFVDADHRYDAVRSDLLIWLPKIRPRGIMCGHDCETRVTPQNRDILLRGCDQDHIEGQAPFPVWHAGVIMAVDEVFQGRTRLWAEKDIELQDGRHGAATLWDICV